MADFWRSKGIEEHINPEPRDYIEYGRGGRRSGSMNGKFERFVVKWRDTPGNPATSRISDSSSGVHLVTVTMQPRKSALLFGVDRQVQKRSIWTHKHIISMNT